MHPDDSVKTDYTTLGFEKIGRDLHFLIGCLSEVLTDLGQGELAALLPWTDHEVPKQVGSFPPQAGLVYSIAFHLLNLVEESAAAQMRALRETELGLSAEHGLWGQALTGLKERGQDEKSAAALLHTLRVEPVLTAHPTEAK